MTETARTSAVVAQSHGADRLKVCASVRAMRTSILWFITAVACSYANSLPPVDDLAFTGDVKRKEKFIRLTKAKRYQGGSVWLREKQTVQGGFDTTFSFRFTDPGGLGGGADGLAFVVQNSGANALGGIGGAGGFMRGDGDDRGGRTGIPFSLAVFFDSFRNEEISDPSDNALHVCVNGRPRELRWPPSRLAVIPHLRPVLKDQQEHTARLMYKPPSLSVYLDQELLASIPDLSLMTDDEGMAWVGITSSTGGGYADHDLLNWNWKALAESSISMVASSLSFLLKECLPGRNLCTPDEAIIEQKAENVYRVVLPAHLEWGASIPNPGGRTVEITNAQGLACWDSSKGSSGCGGPQAPSPFARNADEHTSQCTTRPETIQIVRDFLSSKPE